MALLRKLDADIPPVEDVPLDSAMTTDGMALVLQIRTSKMTFEEFAIKLVCNILSIGQNSERVNVIFDVYRDIPIKDIERKKRSSGNRHQFVGIESTYWNQIKKKQTAAFYFILKMPARTTRIVINLPDTNVFTLTLSKSFSIDANLYFLTGVNNKRKIIDIEAVADKAYQSTWKAVKSLRSLTHLWVITALLLMTVSARLLEEGKSIFSY